MPAAKKVAKKKSPPKKAVAKKVAPLSAQDVMDKYNFTFDSDGLTFVADAPPEPDDLRFFSEEVQTFHHSCAVVEIGGFISGVDYRDLEIQSGITLAEIQALFKYAVLAVLQSQNRKQVIATTVPRQDHMVPLLEAAGFKASGTSKNPGSGNEVTIWVLSI